MLNRAFSTMNPYQHHFQGTTRWKIRMCYGFTILIIASILILLAGWNMLGGLPNTEPEPVLPSGGELTTKLILRLNKSGVAAVPLGGHLVEIFYEVLCPDSRYFILNQFIPTYMEMKKYINPVFIPYGKATTKTRDDRISFECQHGEVECKGNMVHSCAIVHVAEQTKLVGYIGCMINNNRDPEEVGRKCAQEKGINWDPILACLKGTEGPLLLKRHGEVTQALRPSVSFIPTIRIDGSQKNLQSILKNFKQYLCRTTLTRIERGAC